MLSDELAVSGLVAVELKARRPGDQRLQQRLALNERQAGGVPTVEMQKIEGVVDKAHAALAVARACVCEKFGKPSSPMPHSSPSR